MAAAVWQLVAQRHTPAGRDAGAPVEYKAPVARVKKKKEVLTTARAPPTRGERRRGRPKHSTHSRIIRLPHCPGRVRAPRTRRTRVCVRPPTPSPLSHTLRACCLGLHCSPPKNARRHARAARLRRAPSPARHPPPARARARPPPRRGHRPHAPAPGWRRERAAGQPFPPRAVPEGRRRRRRRVGGALVRRRGGRIDRPPARPGRQRGRRLPPRRPGRPVPAGSGRPHRGARPRHPAARPGRGPARGRAWHWPDRRGHGRALLRVVAGAGHGRAPRPPHRHPRGYRGAGRRGPRLGGRAEGRLCADRVGAGRPGRLDRGHGRAAPGPGAGGPLVRRRPPDAPAVAAGAGVSGGERPCVGGIFRVFLFIRSRRARAACRRGAPPRADAARARAAFQEKKTTDTPFLPNNNRSARSTRSTTAPTASTPWPPRSG
jgi:hypothetical protein